MAWRLVLEARCRPTPANGHAVYTPSFTGMGDRAHLLSPDITIDTFVEDLARVILTEELTEVVLVGHSVGGIPISGVADRLPECMAHLVYLDSVVVESGKSAFSYYPQAEVEARINAAEKATNGRAVPIPQPLPSVWVWGSKAITTGSADTCHLIRCAPTQPRSLFERRSGTTYLAHTCI